MSANFHSCKVDFNSHGVYSRDQSRSCSIYDSVRSFIYQHTLLNFNNCTSKWSTSNETLDVRHRITFWSVPVLWAEHLTFFFLLCFLVTTVLKSWQKVTATVFVLQINLHTIKLVLAHCVIAAFGCFSKGASNDGGLCVRWICSVTLLVMLMFITSLMWNFEVPQMVLFVIIHALCSGFVTCK